MDRNGISGQGSQVRDENNDLGEKLSDINIADERREEAGGSSSGKAVSSESRGRGRRNSRRGSELPANFLLNFQGYNNHRGRYRGRGRSQNGRRYGYNAKEAPRLKRQPAFRRREQFVQANYHFAVDPRAVVDLHDANAVVKWDDIDLVVVLQLSTASETNECPICLYLPTCPRITRCGHLFCFLCILKHLSFGNNWLNDCPLCSTAVLRSDLKPVHVREVKPCIVGQEHDFQLLKHRSDSVVCIDARLKEQQTGDEVPQVLPDSNFFNRIVVADADFLIDYCIKDERQLQRELSSDPSLKPLVDYANGEVRKQKIVIQRRKRNTRRQEEAQREMSMTSRAQVGTEVKAVFGRGPLEDAPRAKEGRGEASAEKQEDQQRRMRFFYQAADMQMFFMHPINVRMILHECGDFNHVSDFELTKLRGELLEIDKHVMGPDSRKRYKFLSHLPDACEFAFVELDLSSVVSKETMEHFSNELRRRKVARKHKKQVTARESRNAQRQENKLLEDHIRKHSRATAAMSYEDIDSEDHHLFPSLANSPVADADRTDTAQDVPGSAWGGADVSSYASITNQMGLFPELSRSVPETSTSTQNSIVKPLAKPDDAWRKTSEPSVGDQKREMPEGAHIGRENVKIGPKTNTRRNKKRVTLLSNATGARRR